MSNTLITDAGPKIRIFGTDSDSGSKQVLLPGFQCKTCIRIKAWSTGYAESDATGNQTATLSLLLDGQEVRRLNADNFGLYQLEIEMVFFLDMHTGKQIEARFGNHMATMLGSPPAGLEVTIQEVPETAAP